MDKPISQIERKLEPIASIETEGLDNQSFFDACEPTQTRRKLPSDIILHKFLERL